MGRLILSRRKEGILEQTAVGGQPLPTAAGQLRGCEVRLYQCGSRERTRASLRLPCAFREVLATRDEAIRRHAMRRHALKRAACHLRPGVSVRSFFPTFFSSRRLPVSSLVAQASLSDAEHIRPEPQSESIALSLSHTHTHARARAEKGTRARKSLLPWRRSRRSTELPGIALNQYGK